MLRRTLFLLMALALTGAWAQDDWDNVPAQESSEPQAQETVVADSASASSSSVEASATASSSSVAPVSREVPVRYWVAGDSVELEAIFVKIEKDTVYLKAPTEAEMKKFAKLEEKANVALQESNGQEVEEDEDEEVEVKKDTAEIIMTDAVKNSMAEESDSARAAREAAEQLAQDASDDFETALKNAEIAKVEEEIRQREIQDSIEAANANPFIKIFRLNLKRLYNLEDNVMIDLSLSNYVVPVVVEEEEQIELYPPGKANLLVVSAPAACSLFVNGIPLKIVAPDTIKNIKPGKYTISVMKVLTGAQGCGMVGLRRCENQCG